MFKKLFLIKEIRSKSGELHFRRYRLFWTPWLAIYIHRIYKSDEDLHPHNHPWNFISFILSGGYTESCYSQRFTPFIPFGCSVDTIETSQQTLTVYDSVKRTRDQYHHITLISPTTSLVLTWGKWEKCGYLVDSKFVDFEEYRKIKNGEKKDE